MTAQISERAVELFTKNGYDETTIDDICGVAGISRSTFFRYFGSKEDVLLGEIADADAMLLAALRSRPDSEPPWIALREAFSPLIEHYGAQSERVLRSARLVRSTPTLASLHKEKRTRWEESLRPEVERRFGCDPHDLTDPRPAALIAAALGCLDAAIAAWAAGDGTPPLTQVLARAMGSLSADAAPIPDKARQRVRA
jgi:AcrR family transcriptional regulator